VKRRDLLRHLAKNGCAFLREGGNHTLYINRTAKKVSTIPGTMRSTGTSPERSARTSRSPGLQTAKMVLPQALALSACDFSSAARSPLYDSHLFFAIEIGGRR